MTDEAPAPRENAARREFAEFHGLRYEVYAGLAEARGHPDAVVVLGHGDRVLVSYPAGSLGADEEALRRLLDDLGRVLKVWEDGWPYRDPEPACIHYESPEAVAEYYPDRAIDGLFLDDVLEELGLRRAVEDVLSGAARRLDPAATRRFDMIRVWFAAVQGGDVEAVRGLLDEGVPVDLQHPSERTALCFAALAGSVEIIRTLLDRGADPNAVGFAENTPVTGAVHCWLGTRGRDEGPEKRPLEMLLAAGGRMGLREAVALGDVDLARRICDEDPSIDVGGDALLDYHDTFPMIAAKYGHFAMLRFLLDRGADVEETDDLGRTALIVAAERGRLDMVDLLLDRGADVDHDDWSDCTPLAAAATNGHERVVARLLASGAGRGVLDAIDRGDEPLLAELLKDGFDPEHYYYSGTRAIRFAVERGDPAIVGRLLDAGPAKNVDEYSSEPTTLVAEAARAGRLELVQLLVARGLDPKERGRDGLSALDWAEREGHADVAGYLRGNA